MSPYKDSNKSWNSWSDQMVEQFRRLYDRGLTHSEIAREMGHGITRNACIGKAHRLKLPMRAAPRKPYPKRRYDLKAKPRKKPAPQRRMERPKAENAGDVLLAENPPQDLTPPETHHRKPPPPPPLIPRITPTIRAEPVPVEARVKRASLDIPLLEIARDQCRFIEGEVTANTLMCGQPIWPGSGYCGFHHALAWHSAPARSRGPGRPPAVRASDGSFL